MRLVRNATVLQVRDPSVLNELLNRTTHTSRRSPPTFAARRQYVIVLGDKARAIIGVNQRIKNGGRHGTVFQLSARAESHAPGSHGEARGPR